MSHFYTDRQKDAGTQRIPFGLPLPAGKEFIGPACV